jgi:ubiquinone/menaquinone biosynthesis C-methylase UbiE
MPALQDSLFSRDITRYIRRISAVYDVDKLIQQSIGTDDVVDYYVQSNLGYRLLHSLDGSIHMAISQDERFRFEDYLAQVNYITQQIGLYQPELILELGCGEGFNLLRLAETYRQYRFVGVDITPMHIEKCLRKSRQKDIINAEFKLDDFHTLDYPTTSVDMVFAVESICHAQDIFGVLAEVYRVLKPGGIFIIFDGFRIRDHATLSTDEKTARYLIEKTLAVNESINIDAFISESKVVGFKIIEHTDLSHTILPNLERFHSLARFLFEFSPIGHIARSILPKYFVQNAIAAYLMPLLVGNGTQGYFRLCYQKPNNMDS